MEQTLYTIFSILSILILLTGLLAGWWLLFIWNKDRKLLNSELVEMGEQKEADRIQQEIKHKLDDFKEELAPIRTELNEIKKLITSIKKHD